MLRTLLRDENNQFRVVADPSAISEIVLRRDRLLWLDLERPTRDEFALIQEEFGLHPLAIEDAMSRHQRPKVENYADFYLVIFYTVAFQEPGAKRIPGRRGLTGSSFVRPDILGRSQDRDREGAGEEDEAASVPVVEHEEEGLADEGEERIVLNELALFMGENYLITVHDHPVPELEEAARRWTQNVVAIKSDLVSGNVPGTRRLRLGEKASLNNSRAAELNEGQAHEANHSFADPGGDEDRQNSQIGTPAPGQSRDVGVLLYSLLDTIVDNYFPVIDSIVERAELVEEQIFEHQSQNGLETIFALKKDLLALRRVLAPERDVLNLLTRRDLPIFDEPTILYFRDVHDHLIRVTDSIDIYRDLLSSAVDGYLSMQSNRLTITVQALTSISIILMSVAAVTGWYGMNFEMMPELTSALGYPGVIAVVAALVAVEVIFFKRKGWL